MIDDVNFTVTGERARHVTAWLDSHGCTQRYTDQLDSPAEYSEGEWVFRSCGIGWRELFRCDCGKELDFTDVSTW
jgi:hypothetical protein